MKSAKWCLRKELFVTNIKILSLKVERVIFSVSFLLWLSIWLISMIETIFWLIFTNLTKLDFGWICYIGGSLPLVVDSLFGQIIRSEIECYLVVRQMKKQINALLHSNK